MRIAERAGSPGLQRVMDVVLLMQTRLVRIDFSPVFNGRDLMIENIIPVRKDGNRDWGSLDAQRLLQYSKWNIARLGITGRKDLERADGSWYQTLRANNLLSEVGLGKRYQDWAAMSDDQLVAKVQAFMKENQISGKGELRWAGKGMYTALLRRERAKPGIMGRVGFEKKLEDWRSHSDDGFVAKVRAFMKENQISGKGELKLADSGMYQALVKREKARPGINARIGFEKKKREMRYWDSLADDELVMKVRAFMKEREISGRTELKSKDSGMYFALYNRDKARPGLMGKAGFERKIRERRDWESLSDDELVAKAQALMKERGISGREELRWADSGMYQALYRRERAGAGILHRVFAEFESVKHSDAVAGVLDALGSFGDEK